MAVQNCSELSTSITLSRNFDSQAFKFRLEISAFGEVLNIDDTFLQLSDTAFILTYGEEAIGLKDEIEQSIQEIKFIGPMLSLDYQIMNFIPSWLAPMRFTIEELQYQLTNDHWDNLPDYISDQWTLQLHQGCRQFPHVFDEKMIAMLLQLFSKYPGMRMSALNYFKSETYPILMKPFLERLREPQEFMYDKAFKWLEQNINATAFDHLVSMINNRNKRIRIGATELLGYLNDPLVIPYLIQKLEDEVDVVRKKAVIALSEFVADSSVVKALKTKLNDEAFLVRRESVKALAHAEKDMVVGPVLALLRDESDTVRIEAIRSLGTLKHGLAVQSLIIILKGGHPTLRKEAVIALGRIGDKRAVMALEEALSSSEYVFKIETIKALGNLKDPIVTCRLLPLLKTKDFMMEAAEAIGNIEDSSALKELKLVYERMNPSFRKMQLRKIIDKLVKKNEQLEKEIFPNNE